MSAGLYILHLYPGEDETRQRFLREAAKCVDPVRCNKAEHLKTMHAKGTCLGAGMLLQKMLLDLQSGGDFADTVYLEEEELLTQLQNRIRGECTEPVTISYRYGEHGKPSIMGFPKHFNLSHSGEYVVCAVCDGEVGVDIQKWVPFKERTAERFFAPAEWKVLQNLPPAEHTEMFFRLWTRKEAYGKYTGQGIGSAVGENLSGEETCAEKQIRFWEMQPDQGYSVAVCVADFGASKQK